MKFTNYQASELKEYDYDLSEELHFIENTNERTATIVLDIETLPSTDFPDKGASYEAWHKQGLSLYEARVLCIGLSINQRDVKVITGKDEAEVISKFANLLSNYRSAKFVGHNLLDFDLPMLMTRAVKYGHRQLANHIPEKRWGNWAHDTMKQFDLGLKWGHRISLENMCKFYGVESPKLVGEDGSSVAEMYHAKKLHAIAAYCARDVKATEECYLIQSFQREEEHPFG